MLAATRLIGLHSALFHGHAAAGEEHKSLRTNKLKDILCQHWQNWSKKVKEADLYSAFIEVPYTQGAQVRITQCYLQTKPYLPLPREHSPDGASQTEVADI